MSESTTYQKNQKTKLDGRGMTQLNFFSQHKVEKILKGNLDLIQIIGGKVCLRCEQTYCFQKFVDNPQQCFAFMPQANFPAHNLNFQ